MAKAVLVDLRRCIGCRSCQVACKRWNERKTTKTVLNPDPKLEWTNPPQLSPETYTFVRFVKSGSGDSLKWHFAKIQCNHCIDPHCVNGCPTTALEKTEEGPVIYRKELCIGCKYCVNTCPFGVPQWDDKNKIIEKCTFCSERLKEGIEPACVQACPTDTLVLMDLDEAKMKASEAESKGLYTYGLREVGGTSWIYVSDVPFSELGFPEHTSEPPKVQQFSLLTKFVGTGILVSGALLAAIKLYAQRREAVAKAEEGE
ncbi:4Fe-4S dicluster domain-containing protein [Candidatus Bathyarchaeota archaeon]|nr:4Fe-4S dicluster domain-containing protein [Candidatus Bathyarchaeota archaeon]